MSDHQSRKDRACDLALRLAASLGVDSDSEWALNGPRLRRAGGPRAGFYWGLMGFQLIIGGTPNSWFLVESPIKTDDN